KAIERAKTFIKSKAKDGNWESDMYGVPRKGGPTCLAVLALLTAGVPVDDPLIEKALAYIRSLPPDQTYTVGLQTMVLAHAVGLCGLLITGMDLNAGREKPLGNGAWKDCGVYKESEEVKKALAWLGSHLHGPKDYDKIKFADQLVLYYFLYGLERAGRLSGLR